MILVLNKVFLEKQQTNYLQFRISQKEHAEKEDYELHRALSNIMDYGKYEFPWICSLYNYNIKQKASFGICTYLYDNKDNISIELTQDGIWTEISASHIVEDLKVIPLNLPSKIIELLPAKAINYLNQNYQDGHIYTLRHQKDEYNVYVDQQYSLYFDEEDTFLRQDS